MCNSYRLGVSVGPKTMNKNNSSQKTLYDKVFSSHVVEKIRDDGTFLIYIDRHLVHEVTSPQAFEGKKYLEIN